MNIQKLRIALIVVGFGIFVSGAYMTNDALNSIPQNLEYHKELGKLVTSTNYSIGVLVFVAGLWIIGLGVFWKRITSKKQS